MAIICHEGKKEWIRSDRAFLRVAKKKGSRFIEILYIRIQSCFATLSSFGTNEWKNGLWREHSDNKTKNYNKQEARFVFAKEDGGERIAPIDCYIVYKE